jgi:hypothetical protein
LKYKIYYHHRMNVNNCQTVVEFMSNHEERYERLTIKQLIFLLFRIEVDLIKPAK